MPSRRETIVQTILSLLQAGLSGPRVDRGVLTESIPEGGAVTVAEPDEPQLVDVTLGVEIRDYEMIVEIELVVQDGDPTSRAARMDALAAAVAAALDLDPSAGGDPSMGGVCDYARLEELAEAADLPFEGADAIKGAILPVNVHYSTGATPQEAV